MFEIELRKDFQDGNVATERKSFENKKDAYQYIMLSMLETYIDSAKKI